MRIPALKIWRRLKIDRPVGQASGPGFVTVTIRAEFIIAGIIDSIGRATALIAPNLIAEGAGERLALIDAVAAIAIADRSNSAAKMAVVIRSAACLGQAAAIGFDAERVAAVDLEGLIAHILAVDLQSAADGGPTFEGGLQIYRTLQIIAGRRVFAAERLINLDQQLPDRLENEADRAGAFLGAIDEAFERFLGNGLG
jgi:hypothetical protein